MILTRADTAGELADKTMVLFDKITTILAYCVAIPGGIFIILKALL